MFGYIRGQLQREFLVRARLRKYSPSNGLLGTINDALGQHTAYTYNVDNTKATISYASPTPDVDFKYGSVYQRLTRMTDGAGTTTYTYYPVGKLGANQQETVTSPIAGASSSDTVTYTYDALNRVVGTNVDGTNQTVAYDALGRTTGVSNALDSFAYSYSDPTSRVTGAASTNGPTLAMSYYGPSGDELLEQITATHSTTTLAQYSYVYNSDGNVTSFATALPTAQTTTYGYDATNRLKTGLMGTGTPQYQYGYDAAQT
jgi:YD repeat-containing protein